MLRCVYTSPSFFLCSNKKTNKKKTWDIFGILSQFDLAVVPSHTDSSHRLNGLHSVTEKLHSSVNASSRHHIRGVAFFSWTTELPIAPSSRIHQHAFTQPLGPNYIYHWHDMLLVRYSGARCHRPGHFNKCKEIYGWIRSLTCQDAALTLRDHACVASSMNLHSRFQFGYWNNFKSSCFNRQCIWMCCPLSY